MKKLIIILVCVNICIQIFASPATPAPFKVTQPNGDTIFISLHGDEYASWYEDDKGNIVDKNNDNYWVYVTTEEGKITLTNQIVSQTSTPININQNLIFDYINKTRNDSSLKINKLNDYLYKSRSNNNTTGEFTPLASEGQQKILTILIQFKDIKFTNQNTVNQHISNIMNLPYSPLSTGKSVRNYYLNASYDKLDITSTVFGPYTAKNNRTYYGGQLSSIKDIRPNELAKEAIEAVLASNPNLDLSQFDNNNDSWVECVHIVFAGNAQNISLEPSAIWPRHDFLNEPISKNGIKISRYIMTQEIKANEYKIGIICHELCHALGAPDFYDTNESKNGEYEGTGMWDLMANGDKNNNMTNPAHPNPYIKTEMFRWTTAKELIGNDSLYTLYPSELDSNSIYKLSTSTPNEYYLLENRQDYYLPGQGLVIYHVNADIQSYISNNEVNTTHPQNMYVVDANHHIEKPTEKNYGFINSDSTTFKNYFSSNIYFTSSSTPSNCAWDKTPTQNKDICFISEEYDNDATCIKFVFNPKIEGPDVLCDSAIYSLKYVPMGSTITWTYTRPSDILATTVPLIIGSGQGTTAVCFKRGYKLVNEDTEGGIVTPENPFVPAPTSARGYVEKPYSGFIEIQAKVTFNGETKIWRKTIYMPEKVEMNTLNLGTINYWYAGTTKTITLKSPTDPTVTDSIKWYIELPGETPREEYGSSITATPTNGGTARFTATYINGCNDEYMSHTKTYSVVKLLGWTYTNPASGSVEISVVNGDAPDVSGMRTMPTNNLPTPYMGAYRVELWHDVYGKVRELYVAENNPTITMNLDGLNSGIYIMRLIVDNQIIENAQIIIK